MPSSQSPYFAGTGSRATSSGPIAGYTSGFTSSTGGPAAAAGSPARPPAMQIPQPASRGPQFQQSKGAFCGKVIVQPPGGRTTLNIFGGP
jgi:hypothetical protein